MISFRAFIIVLIHIGISNDQVLDSSMRLPCNVTVEYNETVAGLISKCD